MKRYLVLLLLVAVVAVAAVPAAAHGRHGHPAWEWKGAAASGVDVNLEFLVAAFGIDRGTVLRYSRYGLSTEELTLVLYLGAVGGRPPVRDGNQLYRRRP